MKLYHKPLVIKINAKDFTKAELFLKFVNSHNISPQIILAKLLSGSYVILGIEEGAPKESWIMKQIEEYEQEE